MRSIFLTGMLLAATGLLVAAPVPVLSEPNEELHVVALYEGNTKTGDMLHGGKATVKVDRPGKSVTLLVSSYDSVTWDVTVTPMTKLVKVIVGGYHEQAANAPAGTEVIKAFLEGREKQDFIRFNYTMESGEFRRSVQEQFKMTGREIASFQGQYRFDPKKPIVVDSVQKDARLSSDFPKVEPAANLPKFKFQAVRSTPDRFGATFTFGDFSAAGPDTDSLLPLPKGIGRIARDPMGKKYYGIDAHDIYEVDLEKGKSAKMNPGLGVPRMSWMGGIAFDTKRERLVVATYSGGGILYTYTPKTGVWAAPAELKGAVSAGLVYHPADDTLYGLQFDGGEGGKNMLSRINAQGAIVKKVELAGPMFPGVLSRGPDSHVQMISVGDHIAILVQSPGVRDGNGQRRPGTAESFLFLLDPKTDQVKLAWKESR